MSEKDSPIEDASEAVQLQVKKEMLEAKIWNKLTLEGKRKYVAKLETFINEVESE